MAAFVTAIAPVKASCLVGAVFGGGRMYSVLQRSG